MTTGGPGGGSHPRNPEEQGGAGLGCCSPRLSAEEKSAHVPCLSWLQGTKRARSVGSSAGQSACATLCPGACATRHHSPQTATCGCGAYLWSPCG
eukprot:scaffold1436_cov250-Pinguiococcus_pyrenoidosus.AAC.16